MKVCLHESERNGFYDFKISLVVGLYLYKAKYDKESIFISKKFDIHVVYVVLPSHGRACEKYVYVV